MNVIQSVSEGDACARSSNESSGLPLGEKVEQCQQQVETTDRVTYPPKQIEIIDNLVQAIVTYENDSTKTENETSAYIINNHVTSAKNNYDSVLIEDIIGPTSATKAISKVPEGRIDESASGRTEPVDSTTSQLAIGTNLDVNDRLSSKSEDETTSAIWINNSSVSAADLPTIMSVNTLAPTNNKDVHDDQVNNCDLLSNPNIEVEQIGCWNNRSQ